MILLKLRICIQCDKLSKIDSLAFNGCEKLKTIFASESFVTQNVEDSEYMFNYCLKLVGGNGTTYDNDFRDHTYACIDTPEQKGYFTMKA